MISLRKEASGLRLFISLLWDHEVGGSNPLTPTIIKPLPFCKNQERLFANIFPSF